MKNQEKIFDLKKRTREFSLQIIQLYRKLPPSGEAKIMGNQLLRSATSVGANYRAACRSRSDAEFFSKICIVVEEVDETEYWLDLIKASEIYNGELINKIIIETEELIKIFVTIRNNEKKKRRD